MASPVDAPALADPEPQNRRAGVLLGCLFCVATNVVLAGLYLPNAGFWNDEATQLAGITLNPIDQVRWLTNHAEFDFGVPDDRMPPLSYWSGWAWAQAFGPGERAARWLSVTTVGLATVFMYLAALEAWGLGAALACGLLFGMSPNVLVQAVEIRAYPQLILWSAAAAWCFVHLLTAESRGRAVGRWWVALMVCLILACYTHFYGVVLSFGLLASLLVRGWRRGGLGVAAGVTTIVAVASLGLLPFITAAVGLTARKDPSDLATNLPSIGYQFVRLFYRLYSHAAVGLFPALVVVVTLGLVLLAAATARVLKEPSPRSEPARWLLLGWVAGVSALVVGQMVSVTLGILGARWPQLAGLAEKVTKIAQNLSFHTSYNIWMIPVLALLAAAGLGASSRRARRLALLGTVLVLAGYAYADYQLAMHGRAYAHTPYVEIAGLIRQADLDRVAIVHDETEPDLAAIMGHPLRWEFGRRMTQYCLVEDPTNAGRLLVVGPNESTKTTDPTELPFDELIVMRSNNLGSNEVNAKLRFGLTPLPEGPIVRRLKSDPRWRLVHESNHLAYGQVDLDIFRRNPEGARKTSSTDAPRASER